MPSRRSAGRVCPELRISTELKENLVSGRGRRPRDSTEDARPNASGKGLRIAGRKPDAVPEYNGQGPAAQDFRCREKGTDGCALLASGELRRAPGAGAAPRTAAERVSGARAPAAGHNGRNEWS
ncbi:hypothetical protein TRIP_B50610 [uncultured Desulfatiglans sp.]|nr:hypothetical protein TRIP_B50610 [uncultured Desulfatiglans sp.]